MGIFAGLSLEFCEIQCGWWWGQCFVRDWICHILPTKWCLEFEHSAASQPSSSHGNRFWKRRWVSFPYRFGKGYFFASASSVSAHWVLPIVSARLESTRSIPHSIIHERSMSKRAIPRHPERLWPQCCKLQLETQSNTLKRASSTMPDCCFTVGLATSYSEGDKI